MKYVLTPIVLGAAIMATSAMPAEARNSFNLSIGAPAPVYYQPVPVYYAPPPPVYYTPQPVYYQPASYYPAPSFNMFYSNGWERHRNYDWGYWNRGNGHGHGNGHHR